MLFCKKPLVVMACAVFGGLAATGANAVDLIGVHDSAARNDPQLLAAGYRRDATGENERLVYADMLPQLSGSASMTRGSSETFIDLSPFPFPEDEPDSVQRDNDIDSENWGLTLSQSLYRQSNYERLDLARGQISRAEADYQLAYQGFLVRVAVAYFDVLTAEDGVTFAEAEEKALQRQFEQAEQRFEVGLTAVTDVHEARAQYDRARARSIVARNQRDDAYEGLRELTGQSFTTVDELQEQLPLETPNPNSAQEWVELALQTNPAVLSARHAVEVAEANVRLERSGHFPTLDAFASYTDSTNNEFIINDDFGNELGKTALENKDTRYGLRLNVPIYQGGFVTTRTRQAGALLDAAMQDEEAQRRQTVRQTETAYRAVLAGIEQVQAFRQALISAQSALEATQAGFEVGTRTIVDVLISEQRYFQAERDNSVARHTYILDHLRLKAAAGMLSKEDLAVVNTLLQ